eukprot:TRINITY_DN4014_c0_g1_i1.p1 TRINITY_DN4014_c0_g1~~TRINITY_DN4014_c0_g1_i1.p1  ORF type:complete len:196 (-),score=29.28 TRINITY_DN4014_c0_g1_i1:52-639(-)
MSIYQRALISAAITYVIVLYTSVFKGRPFPGLNMQAWAPVLLNDNMHYLLMCVTVLNTSVPITLALIPLMICAFYHIMDNGSVLTRRVPMLNLLFDRARPLRSNAMLIVAYTEILTMVMLLFLTLTGAGSILSCLMYFQFLQMRFLTSANSRTVWGIIRATLDRWTEHPRCPPIVRRVYGGIKTQLARIAPPQAA